MLGKASPLKPILIKVFKSSMLTILEVVCESNTEDIFSSGMPMPSSDTSINSIPPFLIFTVIFVACASMELSISSLTTDDGLSTTSPAAI